tara:strand:- start:5513 stop:5728 length:216 start_codon:yes stop_codon:yes gene_type:complete
MTYVNAELESTTLEIEIDASEIVAEAECEIETIVDDVINSNDLISREQVEDMIEEAITKVFTKLGVVADEE